MSSSLSVKVRNTANTYLRSANGNRCEYRANDFAINYFMIDASLTMQQPSPFTVHGQIGQATGTFGDGKSDADFTAP